MDKEDFLNYSERMLGSCMTFGQLGVAFRFLYERASGLFGCDDFEVHKAVSDLFNLNLNRLEITYEYLVSNNKSFNTFRKNCVYRTFIKCSFGGVINSKRAIELDNTMSKILYQEALGSNVC